MLTRTQRLKLELLADGMTLSGAARARLTEEADGRPLTLAEYATTSGIPLRLAGDIWVNTPIRNWAADTSSGTPGVLDVEGEAFVVRKDGFQCPAVPTPVPAYNSQRNSVGEPHTWYGTTHTDRVRVSPIAGCTCDCAFCDSPRTHRYATKRTDLLIETIGAALADPVLPARHAMLSGGTPNPEDYSYLAGVYDAVLAAFPSLPVDVMMLPIPGVLDLERLRANGVNELAINLELYGKEARRRLIPKKNAHADRERSLAFIEKAVSLFSGRVRSLILVGLEPLEDTIRAVQALTERGCEPVLSPFCPHSATPMATHPAPSADLLTEAYERASEVARRSGMRLGPKCIPCQHNTLTFPNDSGYYAPH